MPKVSQGIHVFLIGNEVSASAAWLLSVGSRGGVMETVGLLGPVTREQAMSSLVSAPLLEDLAEWSQWELVFQPQLGPLKDFIESNSGTNLIKMQ